MAKKKNSEIVYVPSFTDIPSIKEQISQISETQYEAQGVKYQGFYRNPYTKEVRTQSVKRYYGAITNAAQQLNFTLSKKRFIITNVNLVYQVSATAGSNARNIQIIQDYTGTIYEFRQDIILRDGVNMVCDFDFTSSPILITNPFFSILINAGLNATDVINVVISGFEED